MLLSNRWLFTLALLLVVEIHLGSASQLMSQLRKLVQYLEEEERNGSVFLDGAGDDVREAYEDVRDDTSETTW